MADDSSGPTSLTRLRDLPRARKAAAIARAHDGAYGDGEYVGQEGFATASQILALARAAGVGRESRALDLCCGLGNPALYLVRQMGCRVVGVDRSEEAVRIARAAAAAVECRGRAVFVAGDVLRLPLGRQFDAVLLLETTLAFADKAALLGEVRRCLRPGGRLALTLEEGRPLTPAERRRIPEGDRIWLIPEGDFAALLGVAGFAVRQVDDCTTLHAAVAGRLAAAFIRHRERVVRAVGLAAHGEMVAAHARWAEWLAARRVRKLAFVAERLD